MAEDEKVKKWLEEQEKIKSELSILAGSLKGTGHSYGTAKTQTIEDSILQDAELKTDEPSNVPPKAPEEVYVAKEFKLPEKKPEPPGPPVETAGQVESKPPTAPPKLKPTAPTPAAAPSATPAAQKVKPIAPETKKPAKVLSPTPPTTVQPSPGPKPAGTENEFSEIISYIEEKINKTPEYINFDKARELLDTAINHLNQNNTAEALRFAKESQKEVKKKRLKYLRAKKLMKQAKGQMIELKKKGVDIKVQRDLLSQANIALKNNNFPGAMELAQSCLDENAKNL